MSWFGVLGFGVCGVGLRFAVDSWFARASFSPALGTLLVNVLGCLLAGFIFSLGAKQSLGLDPLRMGMIVGFCGGFTTFSGFGLHCLHLMNAGRYLEAAAYGVVTPVVCVLGTGAGFWMARLAS